MRSSQPNTNKLRWLRYLKAAAVCAVSGSLMVLCVAEWCLRSTPIPASLEQLLPATPVLFDRHGRLIAEPGTEGSRRCIPVPLEKVSPYLIEAVVGLEDRRFRRHGGVDWLASLSTAFDNLLHGRIRAGASTITQQLVKNSQPPQPRTLAVKVREAAVAIRLEREWSKDRILERYLNVLSYGNRLTGIEAAARDYFGKSAQSLNQGEAILLACLPRAPSRYNPRRYPNAAAARYKQALQRLTNADLLSPAQAAIWQNPPSVLPAQMDAPRAPHFVANVLQHSDLDRPLRTTLDLALQSHVEMLLSRHLARLKLHGVNDAAVVVIEHGTGAVRAWVGSPSWAGVRGQIDGVTLPRSVGSILKPFLYLRCVDQKILTAASLLPDTPDAISHQYANYTPRNYDQRHWGPVRLREALANSLNIPAVVALSQAGARQTLAWLADAGISTSRGLETYGAGLILGNAEVTLLDATSAFGVFTNGGVVIRPIFLESQIATRRVIASPQAASILCDILSDNEARRKSFGPFTPLAFEGYRVPCKTGTSAGFRDAWTIGSTARHTVGVWLGNFSGQPMHEVASITGPAPLWRDIIATLLPQDGGISPMEHSTGLRRAEVCSTTGVLPTLASPSRIIEWFLPDTEPTTTADTFYKLDGNGGYRLTLPDEYAVWCASDHNYLGATVGQSGPLRIIHPRPDTTFVMDRNLTAGRQRIHFQAIAPAGRRIHWHLNGTSLGDSAPDDGIPWQIQPGVHQLLATDGQTEAAIRFTVRP